MSRKLRLASLIAAYVVSARVDATALLLTCPPDVTVECLADTGTNTTGVATASGSCTGGVTISYSDVFASDVRILGIAIIGQDVKLTWQTLGNSTNVVQVAAPIIGSSGSNSFQDLATIFVPGTGKVITNFVEFGGATNPPSRFYRIDLKDTCSISRTWTATDACGNATSCEQTICVVNDRPTCDLVGWWKFDEGSGSTAIDSSGNGDNGILINNPLRTNGIFGSALQFNGSPSNSYVDVPISSSLDSASNALTVSAWVNTTNSTSQAVVSYRAHEYDSGWRLFYDSNSILFQWMADCIMQGVGASSTPLPSNQWVHIAAVFNPPTVSLYLNGSLIALGGSSGSSLTLTTNNTLKIGRCDSGNPYWFNGGIDDVRVYRRALSVNEITALFNVDTVGDGIPDWWRLNYFGSAITTNSDSCAACDPVGDGLTNLQAYQHGVDPLHHGLWRYVTAWAPNSTTITISPTGVGNIYYTTDTVSIATSDGSNIRVFTFRTNEVYQGQPTSLSGLLPGHYFVESAGTGGAMGDRTQFLVLPSNYSGAAEWGADYETPTADSQLETLRRVGVGYVRDFSYWYNLTNPNSTPGQYDWTSVDDCLASADSLGAKAVFEMGFWPKYMTNASQCTISAYLQYVTDLCNHIRTNQHAASFYGFTLWNEPNPNNGDFHFSVPDTNSVYNPCTGLSTVYPWPTINGWNGGWTNWLALMYQQAIPVIRSILTNAVVLGESSHDFAAGDALLSYFQQTGILHLLDGESHHYYDPFGLPDQPNPSCYNVSLPVMLDRELAYYAVPSNTVWIMEENALYGSAAAGGAPSSVLGIPQSFGGGPPFYLSHMDWWNGFCDAIKTAVIFKSRNVHPILHVGMRGYHNAGPEIPYVGWAASPAQNGVIRLRGPYPFRSSWIAAWSWLNGATFLSSQSVQTNNTTLSVYQFQKNSKNFYFVWTLRGTSATYSLPGYNRVDVFGNAVSGSLITDEPNLFIQ